MHTVQSYRHAVILAACLSILAGCSKEGEPSPLTATVCIQPGAGTKAPESASEGENTIRDVQVFVYKADGALEGIYRGENGTFDMTLTGGEKEFVAFAGCPAFSGSVTQGKESLLSAASILADNSIGAFEMCGSTRHNLGASSTSVSISVKRMVAKVQVLKITNAFKIEAQRSKSLVIDAIYLTNVPGENDFRASIGSGYRIWHNKLQHVADSSDPLLFDGGMSHPLPYGSSLNEAHCFYPYPNTVAVKSYSAEWCERQTRLVIEASYDGAKVYYPVDLEKVERNNVYTFTEITLTKPGISTPWGEFDTESCEVRLEVAPWEEGFTTTETL